MMHMASTQKTVTCARYATPLKLELLWSTGTGVQRSESCRKRAKTRKQKTTQTRQTSTTCTTARTRKPRSRVQNQSGNAARNRGKLGTEDEVHAEREGVAVGRREANTGQGASGAGQAAQAPQAPGVGNPNMQCSGGVCTMATSCSGGTIAGPAAVPWWVKLA